jgi:NitT/TauT family transport system ATP-binding protein
MTSPEHPVVVQGLVHEYTDRGEPLRVLDGVDFSVKRGEFLTIIGPSGCGKTTLLNILAGLLKPTRADTIAIEGRPVTGPSPEKVALVFQDSGLLYWRTARANVEFGLEIRGEPKEERAKLAVDYLRLVGLEGFADKYPSQLSGGMKQRVALARALVLETPILLMDEPFGALDEQTRLLMAEELLRICSDGKRTVLLVTHSLQEAALLSDRIVVLSSRPAVIRGTIEPESPKPRRGDSVENIREELWDLLRDETAKSDRLGAAT